MIKSRALWLRFATTFLALGALSVSGCTGGCYLEAEPVKVNPATSCLDLFGGHSRTDPGVCGAPDLHGTNECDEPLTLPPNAEGAAPTLVEPGQEIFLNLDEAVPPGITKRKRGDEALDYVIHATLGDALITITVGVHDD